MVMTDEKSENQSSYSNHQRFRGVAGTYTPAQDVEALGHGVEGEGNGAEGDAEAHHAAGAVRVLQRELVRRHGAEVLAH
jgi:CobQ-like glutamine amidotransferase family enzyme